MRGSPRRRRAAASVNVVLVVVRFVGWIMRCSLSRPTASCGSRDPGFSGTSVCSALAGGVLKVIATLSLAERENGTEAYRFALPLRVIQCCRLSDGRDGDRKKR